MEVSDDLMIAENFNENVSNLERNLAACFTNEDFPASTLRNLGPPAESNFSFSHINVYDVGTVLASIKNPCHCYDGNTYRNLQRILPFVRTRNYQDL